MNAYSIPGILALGDADQIFQKVCYMYGKNIEDVRDHEKSRKREYVEIRMISMFLFRRKLGYSYYQAGACFNKDHATAIHAEKTVENLLQTDKYFNLKLSKFISDELQENI